jgi:hypothetical protein
MINAIDVRTSADQILTLERGALDRWGKGDPGGFLASYAADITYFDPVAATRIDGHQAMVNYYLPWVGTPATKCSTRMWLLTATWRS